MEMLSALVVSTAPKSKPLVRQVPPERHVTSVRLLAELLESVDRIAAEDEVSRARVIETALEWYVEQRKLKK
jgi:hypothetical protein